MFCSLFIPRKLSCRAFQFLAYTPIALLHGILWCEQYHSLLTHPETLGHFQFCGINEQRSKKHYAG